MDRYKKIPFVFNVILLIWFFFDMIGVSFRNNILVSRSYMDDGIFFAIFLVAFIWFIANDKVGKYILAVWLFMWFATQFYFHWFFTIFGPWKGKIKYFANTIKLIPSSSIYIPDLYHIVLHLFIILSLISTVQYCIKNNKTAEFISTY